MARLIGLKITTRLSYEALESILGEYCQKSYEIALGGLDTTGKFPRKIMVIGFEDQDDRNRVHRVFAARGAIPASKEFRGAA